MTDAPIAAPPKPRRRAPAKTVEAVQQETVPDVIVAETPVLAEPVQDAVPVKQKNKDKNKDKGSHKKHKKNKEAVIIRFENEHLAAINVQAKALGLSRAAWVRMVVAKALAE